MEHCRICAEACRRCERARRRHLPARLRNAISAESGWNDGLALPFVMLPLLVVTEPAGEAVTYWLTVVLLW